MQSLLADEDVLEKLRKDDEKIIQNSLQQNNLIKDYFKKLGFYGNVLVVDIGWKCRMQQGLEQLLSEFEQEKSVVYGCYLGLHRNNKLAKNSYAKGYLFDAAKNHILEHQLMGFAGLLENMCTALHGSVRNYEVKDGKIEPCLYDLEYEPEESKIINEIQENALQFLRDIVNLDMQKYVNITPQKAVENLLKFGFEPTLRQVRLFERFQFFDIVPRTMTGEPLKSFFRGGLHAVKDDFMNCGWRVGYMKKLCRLPLPYGKLYVRLRKKQEQM